jgi:hypothetical protein
MGAPIPGHSAFVWGGAYGMPLMKFTLTYEGELASNGRPAKKWEIRKQFHPQLQELWRINPALKHVLNNRIVPLSGSFFHMEQHHSLDDKRTQLQTQATDKLDLCSSVERGGRKFFPLVRDTFALNCALNITFLRKEEPGRVYQGGDIDNRLKTLFDALAIPSMDQIVADDTLEDPIYCLLEDDRLITGFNIDTRQLLSRPDVSQHHVQLIVDVDVRVSQSRTYNHAFLGD